MTLADRTALVTGANRGIGLAIATALSQKGVRVLAAARIEERASEAASTIGNGSIPVRLDLDDPSTVEGATEAIRRAHGPIDILVNNAAILDRTTGVDVSVEQLTESINVNVISAFATIRALAPHMSERGWGRIVNLSSGWGSFGEGLGGPLAYAVTKAALNAITCSLAQTLEPSVKINAVCPGWVRTRMGGEGASLSPEEGADTPVWLATLPDDGPTGGFFRQRVPIEW